MMRIGARAEIPRGRRATITAHDRTDPAGVIMPTAVAPLPEFTHERVSTVVGERSGAHQGHRGPKQKCM